MSKARIFLISVIALVVLLVGGAFFAESKIKDKVRQGFANLPGAEYEEMSVNLWRGKINLTRIKLDTPLESVAEAGRGKKVVGTIDRAYIDGLHWWDLATSNKLLASVISLENPQLKFYSATTDSTSVSNPTPVQAEETQSFFAQIKSIDLDKGNLEFYGENEKNPQIKLGSFAFSFSEFTFDAALKNDKIAFTDYQLAADSFFVAAGDKLHRLRIEKISTKNRNLKLENLRFDSPHSVSAFMQKIDYRKAYMNLTVPEVVIHDFNPINVFKGKFSAPLVEVNNSNLEVSVDQAVPKNPNDHKILPTEALTKIKNLLHIDSIAVRNARVIFALKSAKKEKYGEIFWDNINADFTNVTADSTAIIENNEMIARTRSRFMGNSRLDLTLRFFLDSPTYAYDFSGKLDTFDMRQTNRMFADISSIQIMSGDVKELTFDVSADDNRATGELKFAYNNLEVQVLGKDGKKDRKVLNWLISKILVEQKTMGDIQEKTGKIDIPRDKSRGIFNQLWISILDGLKEVILP